MKGGQNKKSGVFLTTEQGKAGQKKILACFLFFKPYFLQKKGLDQSAHPVGDDGAYSG